MSTLPEHSLAATMKCFLSSADFFFQNQLFRKLLSGIPSECKKGLDPDQARSFVGPYLGQNCLQRLSPDDTSKQKYADRLTWLAKSVSR